MPVAVERGPREGEGKMRGGQFGRLRSSSVGRHTRLGASIRLNDAAHLPRLEKRHRHRNLLRRVS
jgi:hypothetical protein